MLTRNVERHALVYLVFIWFYKQASSPRMMPLPFTQAPTTGFLVLLQNGLKIFVCKV